MHFLREFLLKPLAQSAEMRHNLVSSHMGGIAQLGERLHGMQEVSSSILLISTNNVLKKVLSTHRLEA